MTHQSSTPRAAETATNIDEAADWLDRRSIVARQLAVDISAHVAMLPAVRIVWVDALDDGSSACTYGPCAALPFTIWVSERFVNSEGTWQRAPIRLHLTMAK
ncbi:hypothetical protein AURDEDRAFT_177050 [Auricularia subglabra TFB-10046 SS5]|uniref:Uncharacterized protein n=1 Tax=Auricularia subglabra (strain TFB-10046 / SS5) TaxID=717982 RepID=J0WND3_AURST|nr:hypothetical protein AURDEDRAFT_177050 [Auricularia subglabra TFB-10046 SS5]